MSKLTLKPLVDDVYYIVENEAGRRVGVVKNSTDAATLQLDKTCSSYSSLDTLLSKNNISISKRKTLTPTPPETDNAYGYPVDETPYNVVWSVERRCALYSKNEKSNCLHAAGYFVLHIDNTHVVKFCPKLIALQRHTYYGPYRTITEANEACRIANEAAIDAQLA